MKKKEKDWAENVFGSAKGYLEFMSHFMEIDSEDLPVMLDVSFPVRATVDDLRKFSIEFREDTGLNLIFHIFTCSSCDKLHVYFEIDEDEE